MNRPPLLSLFALVVALSVGYLASYLRRSARRITGTTRGSSADDAVRAVRAGDSPASSLTRGDARSAVATAGATRGERPTAPVVPPEGGRSCGVVFFYHVNKVGGRTVQEHLKEATHEYLQLFPNEKDWRSATPEIEDFLRFDDGDRWKALEIHHGFPGLLYIQEELAAWEAAVTAQGCAFRKTTLLREPVGRLVSNMKWNKVEIDTLDYATNTADWMSRHLAYNTCDATRTCRFLRKQGITNAPAMTDAAFRSLIEVLDGFDVVGVMEDLAAFVAAVLGRPVALISTHAQDYDDRPYPLEPSTYRKLVELNPYDFRLYWRYAPTVLPIKTERAEDMTLDKMRRYYLLNKPVLVKGAVPLLFDNHADWTSDYVRRHVDPDMVIMANVHTGRLLNGDVNTTVPACMDMPGRCVYFKKTGFSYKMDGPVATEDTDEVRTALLAGLNRRTFAWDGPQSGMYCIYVSSHGGALPHNHKQRFNILTEGRKRWVIVDPLAYANRTQVYELELKEDTGLHHRKNENKTWTGENTKPQEWFRDVVDAGGLDVPHYDFVQEAGDLFFLPNKFTHATVDLTPRTLGIIFKGDITATGGAEHLQFPPTKAEHLPWRRERGSTAPKGDRGGARLPEPSGRPAVYERRPERRAGGAAKRFHNELLDYHAS